MAFSNAYCDLILMQELLYLTPLAHGFEGAKFENNSYEIVEPWLCIER